VYETFITMLNLFSKFKNPARVSEEQRLHKLYSDLLQHRDIAIQKVGVDDNMSYWLTDLYTTCSCHVLLAHRPLYYVLMSYLTVSQTSILCAHVISYCLTDVYTTCSCHVLAFL